MSEENCNPERPKPKISKFAIASLVISCISIIGSYSFILALQYRIDIICPWLFYYLGFLLIPLCLFPSLSVIGFILGILALIKTIWVQGILKDYIFIIMGILLSVLAFDRAMSALGSTRPEARIRICQSNIMELHKAIAAYSKIHNNQYPTATEWCDLLAEQKHMDKSNFLCPDYVNTNKWNREPPYKCSYAINPNAEPNSAGNVVLLFETKDGWNQFGGAELMAFDNHYRKGCNVLFNDGHVEFIAPKQKDKLKWGTETRENRE